MDRYLQSKLVGGKFEGGTPGNSRRMSAIRATHNKSTEVRFRALLVQAGVRGWRLRPTGLPGKPDFLFPDQRLVIFLDGCYWHGCPRCGPRVPSVNRPYWSAKLRRNRLRDRRNTCALEAAGYRVLRLWEHELASEPAACVRRVRELL